MLRADTHSDRMEQEKSKAFDPSVQALRFAMNAIKQHRFDDAYHWLLQAASVDMENSEIFNLLGILYEKKGDRIKAGKFYRVSYYLDQTFSAPSENLHRVSNFFYRGTAGIQWGEERIGGEAECGL